MNDLVGPIPEEICLMGHSLESIDLGKNILTGSIPSCFVSDLQKLKFLDLGDNLLTGQLPSGLLTLPDLEYVNLNTNGFRGSLEGIFGDDDQQQQSSSSLKHFSIKDNRVVGSVPSAFSNFAKLTNLDLSLNRFTGEVDESICAATSLLKVDCDEVTCDCCSDCQV